MTSEAWRRVEAVFEEVAARPAGERTALFTRLCGDDPELRREVAALLAADRRAGGFLDQPALASPVSPPPAWAAGRRIGPYRIEREIGAGGMSTVYLASRADRAYEQQVAIKVLGARPDRLDLLARFRAERQILAALDHPGIARLLDGGTSEEGIPYLVMEYIDGVPIDRYCDERRLGVAARVDLVREVCAAVAAAHRSLVVHRDLKPSNLLVTPDGAPRLLDFGIAKLLEGAPAATPLGGLAEAATRTDQRWLTPSFASPEQVAGGPVTTASDVYALGVMLYLLLTGSLPYRYDPLRLGALEQAVLEQDPTRPSLVVSGAVSGPAAEEAEAIAAARSATPRQLARQLAGDLDTVVLTALAKEPARRYGSVDQLAEDLRRWRDGLPVAARRATVGYRLRKLAARHRLGFAAGLSAALLTAGLAAVMTVQAVRLARQRDEIVRERDKAVQVTQFLQDLFRVTDPGEAQGATVTAREILDTGAARAQTGLAGQPETQAALLTTLGTVYHNLGLDDRARPLLERSLALRRAALGPAHPQVAESLAALADFHLERGEGAEAERDFRQVLALRRAALDDSHPDIAEALSGLGATLTYQARYAEAEPLLQEALARYRQRYGLHHAATAETLALLGQLRDGQGDSAAAVALYRQALATYRQLRGPAHPLTVSLLNELGLLLAKRGDYPAAEAAYRESLAIARRIYGAAHPQVAVQLNNLAVFFIDRGEAERAIPLAREVLARLRHSLGPENPRVALALNNLARAQEETGDLAAAQALFEQAVALQRKALGPCHPELASTLANLARLRQERGDPAAAEPLAREALAIRQALLGPAHPDVGSALVTLGNIRLDRGAVAEAETLLREGLRLLAAGLPAGHWRTANAQSALGACLAARGARAEAGPLLAAGHATLLRIRGPHAPLTRLAERRLAEFRAGAVER